ncbi:MULTISPECIES: hypothetical protein [Ralstonia solanacearum species complex]|uniref:hypothetical protein n=1 Tax=Ralstonia solanacearum species complex TaxID=3116862 RepID=UPI0018D16DA4|nr:MULTISPECIES: hypothetical protein [Ralstonia solanacearum species complex]MDN3368347.1 hypothetical protein [Ralstonia pseudosolanacearum]
MKRNANQRSYAAEVESAECMAVLPPLIGLKLLMGGIHGAQRTLVDGVGVALLMLTTCGVYLQYSHRMRVTVRTSGAGSQRVAAQARVRLIGTTARHSGAAACGAGCPASRNAMSHCQDGFTGYLPSILLHVYTVIHHQLNK